MADLLNGYETIFVIDASLEEEKIAALKERFTNLISENGELVSVDDWGKKRLAYPIDFKTEGWYVFVEFKAKGDLPKEMERVYNITDGILRSLVVRKDEMAGKTLKKGE
jgi:small subunit ribosomal protein S6